jgi:two-component system sensor histidine kinase/response regulator
MKALCDTLQDHGYETTGFSSAQAALKAMEETTFDLLLTDLMMPEMDGISLLQAARQKDPHLVGIIMTGEGTITTAVEAMKSGALDYILKPFKLKAILPVLERALEVRRLRLENAALERACASAPPNSNRPTRNWRRFPIPSPTTCARPCATSRLLRVLVESIGPTLSERTGLPGFDCDHPFGQMEPPHRRPARFFPHGPRRNAPDPDQSSGLAGKIIQGLQPETEGRNIVWKKGPLPVVQADPPLLRQVFSNLLLNAIKYTRPRDPAEIEIGSNVRSGGNGDFCPRQRRRLQHGVCRQIIRRFPAAAQQGGIRGHRHRAGQRPAHHRAPWRTHLGRRQGRRGRHVLLLAAAG